MKERMAGYRGISQGVRPVRKTERWEGSRRNTQSRENGWCSCVSVMGYWVPRTDKDGD